MTDTNKKRELVLFFDLVGRTIIGEKTGEENDSLYIKNPVVVNIMPQQRQIPNQQTGQMETVQSMALQLLPLFFREFLAAPEEGVEFVYNKKNITQTRNQIIFDFKLDIQYDQITNAPIRQQTAPITPPPVPQVQSEGKIKLFDN